MAKRDYGDGSVFHLKGSPYLYIQYCVRGKVRRVSSKTTSVQEANALLRRLLGDAERGVTPTEDLRKVTYESLRQALIDDYVRQGNKSLETDSRGNPTISGLISLDRFFAGHTVVQMTTDAARDFVRERQKKGVANATINRSLAMMRRMLRLAHEDGKIAAVPKIRMLKEASPRKGFLEQPQFEKLMTVMPEDLRPFVTFLYYCGVRCGEAKQVQWEQVNLKRASIHFSKDQTKSGEARIVPMPDVLVEMLRLREPKTGTVFSTTNFNKAWRNSCVQSGLGKFVGPHRYIGIIPHDMRRSAIRNLKRSGVDDRISMSISGHKTRAVFDRYNIVDETDVQNAMKLRQAGEMKRLNP